jgi:integrase
MRDLAEEVKARGRLGHDVIGDKKAKAAEQQAAQTAATVGALVAVFLQEREEMTRNTRDGKPVTPTLRRRTHEQNERYLTTHCASLHGLVVGTVTRGAQMGVVDIDKRWTPINGHKLEIIARSHVVGVINDVAKTRGKVAADRCKAALSVLYAWAMDQGFCDLNPTLNIKARSANERVLSDQELAQVWRACGDNDYGRIVKLLLLTGQRKTEIGDLHWTEVNLGERVIKLPSERVKSKRAHVVPLSAEAVVIIKSTPVNTTRDLVFGRGAGGFGGWTASKVTLDKRIAEAHAKAGLRQSRIGRSTIFADRFPRGQRARVGNAVADRGRAQPCRWRRPRHL